MNQKITLCMIVRNEENNLPRSLQSVKGLADELIVVDTGSVDNTVQVAEQFGAKVIFHPWKSDFSQARNTALTKATGDWILCLDADEALTEKTAEMLRALLDAPDVEGYFFDIVNFTGKNADSSRLVHQSCRLFRNRKTYQFSGRIHEQIVQSILRSRPGAQLLKTNLQIYHYGYLEGNEERRAKVERNIRLLQLELQQNPENAFYEYHLGIGFYELGKKEEALNWLVRGYEHLRQGFGFSSTLIRNIALCLIDLHSYLDAIAFIDKEILNYPDYTDLVYLRGMAYLRMKEYSEAVREFQQCLLLGESSGKYTATVGTGSYLAYYNLGRAYEELLETDKAIQAYIEALHTEPSFLEPLYPLGKLLFAKHQTIDKVICYLETEFDFETTHGLAVMADLCSLLRQDELAVSYLERLKRVQGEIPFELQVLYAKSLLAVGRCQEAWEEFMRVLSEGPDLDAWVLDICIAQWLKNPKESIRNLGEVFLSRLDPQLLPVLHSIDQIWVEPNGENVEKSSFWNRLKTLLSLHEEGDRESGDELDNYIEQLILVLNKILRYRGVELFQEASELLLHLNYPQWRLHFRRGEMYYTYGYLNQAIDEFLTIVEMGIQDERVYFYLGSVCEERRLFSDAENLYCHALNLNDRLFEYHRAAARTALKRAEQLAYRILHHVKESGFIQQRLRVIQACLQRLNFGGSEADDSQRVHDR